MTMISNVSSDPSLEDGQATVGSGFLTFRLDGDEYAVNITAVKAVVGLTHITPVPLMPACVLGLINMRGTVVPIVDLAVKFGGGPTTATKRTCIVIVEPRDDEEIEGERSQVGLIAQSVGRVVEFTSSDLTAPPAFGTKIHANYLSCLGKTPEGFVMILDIDRALSTQELLSESPKCQTIDRLDQGSSSPLTDPDGSWEREAV
jgi:purine-binding chemotaxis protein CheW